MTADDHISSRWNRVTGPFVLLLIVIGFFWKLLLTNQYSWMQSIDLAYQVLPWFQFQAQQFHHHVFPLWDPLQFAGQSLIGQDQPGLAYPLNWILFSLPLRDGHISQHYLAWYFMSIHYFAALFAYWLARDLGRSQIASIAGGVAFGLGGFVGNVDWPQMINGAIWAPLVFLFLFRALRGHRTVANAAFSGLFLGVSFLSGHHQIPIYLTLAASGVWLYSLFERRRLNRTLLLPGAVFLVFFLCAGAFQMWPTFSYGRTAVRWVGSQHDPIAWNEAVPYIVHRQYSMYPRYLIGLAVPGFDQGAVMYVGVVALALLGLGIWRFWKTAELRLLFAIGVGGLLLSLGNSDLFHGILYSVLPVFEKARTPAYAIAIFHFAVAAIIPFGMDALWESASLTTIRRAIRILLAFGAFTFAVVIGVFISNGQTWKGDDRVMIAILAAFALAGLLFRMSRQAQHAIAVLIVGLYLVELGNNALFYLPHRDETDRNVYLAHLDETRGVAGFLRAQPHPLRVWTNAEDVPFNFGDWYGIDVLFGFEPSIPADFWRVESYTQRGRQLYGAAYSISRKPLFADQTEVFRDPNGLAVYKNPDVLPRVWTVHSAVAVKDSEAARRLLQDTSFDIRHSAYFYKTPPRLDSCDGDTVLKSDRGTNWTTATVSMQCRGMLVTSENNAPGWSAYVDGEEVPIYSAYTVLRGVIVGPGRHTVEMRYRPLSVVAGAIATILTFVAALAFLVFNRKAVPPIPQ